MLYEVKHSLLQLLWYVKTDVVFKGCGRRGVSEFSNYSSSMLLAWVATHFSVLKNPGNSIISMRENMYGLVFLALKINRWIISFRQTLSPSMVLSSGLLSLRGDGGGAIALDQWCRMKWWHPRLLLHPCYVTYAAESYLAKIGLNIEADQRSEGSIN